MDLQRINKHKQSFDDICHYIEDDNGADKIEVWFARELQIILGYARWENFQVALTRAVESNIPVPKGESANGNALCEAE